MQKQPSSLHIHGRKFKGKQNDLAKLAKDAGMKCHLQGLVNRETELTQ